MKSLTDCYILANGIKIPCIGFGTWQTPDGEVAVASVKTALEVGYRHIDTAAIYGNEESIGQALKESDIAREELFITTKLWNDEHGYETTLRAFDLSMKKLGLDYLDLYLIHWPNPFKFRKSWQKSNADTWRAFEELYRIGRIRAIGISNFHPHHIDELLQTASVIPMVNQIRLCPGDTQEEVVNYCQKKNILLEAYSPLGVGKIFKVQEIKKLAEKYSKSVAQVCIRWSLQRGYLPLPKSVTPERIKENADVFDFTLSDSDTLYLANLTGCAGLADDPDTVKW
ncbi:MAG: aldo/keto reductase [Deltaproteobacteria bacterium]|jgi:diketogulonate reductase-like aldo/keto reductase|nr:aldo/keto reductase [Deltaproteobacteria bacterium]